MLSEDIKTLRNSLVETFGSGTSVTLELEDCVCLTHYLYALECTARRLEEENADLRRGGRHA